MAQVVAYENQIFVAWAAWPISFEEAAYAARNAVLSLNPPYEGVRLFPAESWEQAEAIKEVLQ